jgi:hypothetical protein
MYAIGRLLQLLGLILLPFAVLWELQGGINPKQLLTFGAFGATVFGLGYVLQGLGTRPKDS